MADVQLLGSIEGDLTVKFTINTGMQKIDFSSNDLLSLDLSGLSRCSKLRTLILRYNKIEKLELGPLMSCKKLEDLFLSGNQLREINLKPLANCRNLRTFTLSGNNLTSLDLTPLSKCSKLTSLYLEGNDIPVIDISPLEKCKKLKKLVVSPLTLLKYPVNKISKSPPAIMESQDQILTAGLQMKLDRYGAPDLFTLKEINEGGFPDHESYSKAKAAGATTIDQYRLIKKYGVISYDEARQKQREEVKKENIRKLRELNRSENRWAFSNIAKVLAVPDKKVAAIIDEYLKDGIIEGELDSDNKVFISSWICEHEIQAVKKLIQQIREGIPVAVSRISEKTGLDIKRCEKVIMKLTTGADPAGEYLDIEGVFIKTGATDKAIDKLLEQYSDWEEDKTGKLG